MTEVTSGAYPPAPPDRISLAAALVQGGGRICGRIHLSPSGGWLLTDESATLSLENETGSATGSLLSAWLGRGPGGGWILTELRLLAPCLAPSPDPGLEGRLSTLRRRAAVIRAIRDFFHGQGFLEVETPLMVPCPGMEPYLKAYEVVGIRRYLRTSPELHMKRMLAAGAGSIFQIAPCFRDDEQSPWHAPGFLMLEWYRAHARPEQIEQDLEQLVVYCAAALGAAPADLIPGMDLTPPWPRATVRGLVLERTGLDLAALADRETLESALRARGLPASAGDDWDTLFFRLFLTEVEPGLGRGRPLILRDYPASQAALARVRDDADFPVAERFELYVNGIELANAFHELNDPAEQRRRHEADREVRRTIGATVYDLDEKFLAALEHGMPPSAGIALGVDRLVAVLLDAPDLASITAFPGE